MDAARFAAWTRRRLGLAAGGALAAALRATGGDDAAAKKKRKKCRTARCRRELESCAPGSAVQHCCPDLNCDVFGEETGLRCCLGLRSRCVPESNHCCGDLLCAPVSGPDDIRCCAAENVRCSNTSDCCAGLLCGQGACIAIPSDRALKANFGSVDPGDMLERVRTLPISTWNYASDEPTVRHIGPTAQDFSALFAVGADDRHIHPIDGQGVALAAIQGLAAEAEALREETERLAARLRDLEAAPRAGKPTTPVSGTA